MTLGDVMSGGVIMGDVTSGDVTLCGAMSSDETLSGVMSGDVSLGDMRLEDVTLGPNSCWSGDREKLSGDVMLDGLPLAEVPGGSYILGALVAVSGVSPGPGLEDAP